MTNTQVIQALRAGLVAAVDLIEQLERALNEQDQTDPAIKHTVEQLNQLLAYSGHSLVHPLYDGVRNEDNDSY